MALDKTSLMYIRHDCLSQDGTGDGAIACMALTAARLFERRKAYSGQFSEATIAFTAWIRGETSQILHKVSRAHVKTYRSWRENGRNTP